MPELPEVNTIAVALNHHLHGDKILDWQRLSPKLRRPLPANSEVKRLLQAPIVKVFRQAKSIFFDFGANEYLHFHLGMTGFFKLMLRPDRIDKHEHLRIMLASGRVLAFIDSRRFGVVEVVRALPERVPEPFKNDLTPDYLRKICQSSNRQIKVLIMDQAMIAGVGNIYASESLFKAGIMPDRTASSLKPAEVKKLYHAMLQVIAKSVDAGLKSLLPKFNLDRETGHFDIETLVYAQAGSLCHQCGKARIENRQIGGRSSFFCPICQT